MSAGSVLFLTILFTGYIYWSLAQPTNVLEIRCKLYARPGVQDTGECVHGAELNPCGKLSCLSGVGDKCGENFAGIIMYGKCASGLMCCGGQCVGCKNGICDHRLCPPKLVAVNHHQFGAGQQQPPAIFPSLYKMFDYYSSETE
uniref:Putative ovarian ecdysteroidogenic hormone i n=1 Tax=Culex tarsalis TaxID=7177 RepID=A0A1Q3FS95_CULTA